MAKLPKLTKEEILARVPPGHTRIKVQDRHGQKKYRKLDEIYATDTLLVSPVTGQPFTMEKEPGRPPKEEPPKEQTQAVAKADELAARAVNSYVAESVRQRHLGIQQDPILRTAKTDPESSDLLHNVVIALAEEAASLGHERLEAETAGRETSQISVRRVNALKAVAETWLKRKDQVVNKEIDLSGVPFQALFNFIMETFRGAMEDSGMRSESVGMVFDKVTAKMQDGWEVEARNRMKQAK